MPAEPPPEAVAIAGVLVTHRDRGHAITAPRIAQEAGLWADLRDVDRGTRVRELITTWFEAIQIDGHVLLASDSGYFHSSDPAEVTRYCRTLRGRAMLTMVRYRRVRIQAQSVGMVHRGHGQWEGGCNAE